MFGSVFGLSIPIMYMYVCTYIHTCSMHPYVCTYVHVRTYVRSHAACTCVYVRTYVRTYVRMHAACTCMYVCMYVCTHVQTHTHIHIHLLEVTKQQICMKYCSSVLYYQLQGSWSDVGHCVNLWFTSNKATALLPTNLLHVPDRTA